MDPLSASPIFLALTRDVSPTTRRELSWRVTLNSFAGTTVVIRLSAFLLLCIGVQIVWNGADALLGC